MILRLIFVIILLISNCILYSATECPIFLFCIGMNVFSLLSFAVLYTIALHSTKEDKND